ncbi:polyribonucleotide nucleotidyltransferase [Buchnera aphidicola (Neophyllaphis podocarpi)]|uniref:polyribonucleotide nucleotidyltransferase n=1 Tax=Buchnera aphidicola TaxID=9 RepID=UPI0031B829F1
MFKPIFHKFKYGNHIVTLETGIMGRQATSAVMASMDDTSVFVTVVCDKTPNTEKKFFPLTVNYQERTYAAGRIPGGFFRREGRPNENEILVSRLIDRPIRPLFSFGFTHEVQIIATVVSVDPQINPDIIAIIGASAALSLSGIPFNGPIGAARIGYINNDYILNPTVDEMKNSDLDLVISSKSDSILMVEAEANILTEEKIMQAILFGHKNQQIVINNINNLVENYERKSFLWEPVSYDIDLFNTIKSISEIEINKAYDVINMNNRFNILDSIKKNIFVFLTQNNKNFINEDIEEIFKLIQKNIVRMKLLNNNLRIDGRDKDMIRALDIRTGVLPRTHGSSLFTRGDTQSLVSVTLGTSRDAQNIDEILGDRVDNFLFHYNFPPYSTGEIGLVGSPKRREIGHGRLAKKSILAVMPNIKDFPYTVRIVSEITESNGSSSMASVCGASLALMDAGVPIKSSVAGIAMGLIKEGDNYVILSDILGYEDNIGDMDLKVAGNRSGITALQMDIKTEFVDERIIKTSLNQAKGARLHILDVMDKALSIPRLNLSKFAPRIYTIQISPEKIKDIIGKGGSVIRMLTEETGTIIEIEDNGIIKISSNIEEKAQNAILRIKEITTDIEVGKIYEGKVTRIVDFGAFVSIGISKEGLVHISQIADKHVNKVTDYLNIDQEIKVKVLEIDRQGRLRLSMKEITK